jgi:hypothetical protein
MPSWIFGDRSPGDLGGDGERNVDAGGDAAAGIKLAVGNDALGDRLGAEGAQHVS